MVELTRSQRAILVEKVPDFANVAAGALIFGDFLSGRTISLGLVTLGLGTWVCLVALAVWWARKQER